MRGRVRARGSSGPGATAVRSAWISTSSTSSGSSGVEPIGSGRRRPAARAAYDARPPSATSPRWAASSSAAHHLVGARRRPARALPGDVRDDATPGRCRSPAPRRGRARPGRSSVIARVSGAIRLVSSGSRALRALPRVVARADQERQPLGLQPRGRQRAASAAAAGSSHQLSNASVGVHAGLPSASGQVASSPAAAATSTSSAVAGSSSCTTSAAALRSRTATAPVRSADRRSGAPVVDQQLHPAYDVERRAGRGAVDQVGGTLGRRDAPAVRRRARASCARRAARSAPRPGIARGPADRGRAVRAPAAPRPGVVRLGRRDRVPGRSRHRPRREPVSTCSSIARAARETLADQRRDLGPAYARSSGAGPTATRARRALRSAVAARRRPPTPAPGRAARRQAPSTAARSALRMCHEFGFGGVAR